MDHVMPCIFDDVLDPNDTDALTLFLDDLNNDPTGNNILSGDDTFDSILNEDTRPIFPAAETSQDDIDMVSSFRSPQAPPYSAVSSVQSPAGKQLQQTGSLGTSVQQTTVPSPRILHQPGTPGSLPESPYNLHNPATPSPASRQQSTPSPMHSPAPAQINPFQQHQQAHDAKFLNSNLGHVQSPQAKQQLQTHVVIQGQQLQPQPQLAQHAPSTGPAFPLSHQLGTTHISAVQNNTVTAPIQLQIQGAARLAGTQQAAAVLQPQVQRAVLQNSLGSQIILQPGLQGQVQLRPNQLVSPASVARPRQAMVTIAASNIHPPSLQAPPNINIMNLQNQIRPVQQQQQVLVQQNTGDNQNMILTTLPGSNIMQLSSAGNQQTPIQTTVVLNQTQAQLLLAKGGQKVQGQVFLQSQPVGSGGSQVQVAGVRPSTASPNTLAIQNQGHIINLQQVAAPGSVMQTGATQNMVVNQTQPRLQNIPQQKHLIQVNGNTMALTTLQLQQLIALQQKRMMQQPMVQQGQVSSQPQIQLQLQAGQTPMGNQIRLQGQPRLQNQPLHGQPQVLNPTGTQPIQILQHTGVGTQVVAANSTTPNVALKPAISNSSQQTQATQVAVQQNLLEIRDKFMKQNPHQPPPLVGDLQAFSQNNTAGTVQDITRVVTLSSQTPGIPVRSAQTSVAPSLAQPAGLPVLGAAGQPGHNSNPVNIVGQGPIIGQPAVQPAQANAIQLQKPTVSVSTAANNGNLVTMQAVNISSSNPQPTPNKQQLSQFRQILPSTSQLQSTTSTATSASSSATTVINNFASLLPSATSKPNVVAPNVNIQTLGLGNQVNSHVLQQQLLHQQKERQLQQLQQKASPRQLAGQAPSNASLALQQLNIAQQQRIAHTVQQSKSGLAQQATVGSGVQPVMSSSSAPHIATNIAPYHTSPPSAVTVTVSAQQAALSSPILSSSSGTNQVLMSSMQQKLDQNGAAVSANLATSTITPSHNSAVPENISVVNSVRPPGGLTPAQQLQLQVHNSSTPQQIPHTPTQQPVVQQPTSQQSMLQQTIIQPTVGTLKQHTGQQPTFQQPVMQQSTIQQHTIQQPTIKQRIIQQPTIQQPTIQQPTQQQPTQQQPTQQQPTQQQPTQQQPTQQPTQQQPTMQQTVQQPTLQQPTSQAPPRVATIQLTPQLQLALATVQQKMKAILAIQNRTDPQNATLRQLMEWQQKIILLGRSHALKAQQQQIPQQQVQQQPNEPQPAAQSQQPRVTNGEAATGSVQITNPQPQTQQLQHQQMSAVGHDTSATGGLGGAIQVQQLVTTSAPVSNALTTTFVGTTTMSPVVVSNPPGLLQQNIKSIQEKQTITNINQLPPEMKEKLRLQLGKLNPSQLDYFLKNQANVLSRLLKQQHEMQQQQEQSAATAAAAAVVKAASDQKKAADIQQGGSTTVRFLSQPSVTAVPAGNVNKSPATIIASSSAISASLKPPHVTTMTVPIKMSRKQLFNHYITKDQKKIQAPDCKDPFLTHKDVLKKLLAYHVHQVKHDKVADIWKGEEAYEKTARELLEKKDQMFKKYQYLILEESMRHERTAEMVMLERMFLASEREALANDKKLAADDPDSFVPLPYLSMSSDEDDSGQDRTLDDSFSSPTHQRSNSSLMSPNTSTDTKHSSDSQIDEPHSPGGNYTLRASSGLKLVFRTSPMHNNVSSPAPLMENYSVKSEDSGICSQQNSVETIDESQPPRKKMRNSSEEKEHYRTNIGDRKSSAHRHKSSELTDKHKIPFHSYKDEDFRQDSTKEVKFSGQDEILKPSDNPLVVKHSDLDGFGISEADTAVAGLLSSSDMLSQDLGAYSDDLFSGMTLEQHLSQGLPDDFMADSDKETETTKPHNEYYSEISDYDTDGGEKEQSSQLQHTIGGLLSDMDDDDQNSYGNNLPFHNQSDHLIDQTSQSDSDDLGQSSKISGSSDDLECTDETRSAIDSLLALDPSQDLGYV